MIRRKALPDPLEYGRKCGLAGISYVEFSWPASEDYIEFARGWRAGNEQRKREEKLRLAQDAIAAKAWRAELESSRFEAARQIPKKGDSANRSKQPRRLKAKGAAG